MPVAEYNTYCKMLDRARDCHFAYSAINVTSLVTANAVLKGLAESSVLIAAHGNSLRALVKYLDKIPDDKIVGLNIPTGIPLVYELNDDVTLIRYYYLGDPEAVQRAIQSVADQLKKKNGHAETFKGTLYKTGFCYNF